ncbi:Molybdopterin synthase sulfur carrier subunit [Balamuthia mandrillaris]
MKVKCLFFAASKEVCGQEQKEFADLEEGTTVRQLLARLNEEYPALQQVLASAMVALNQDYVDPHSTQHDPQLHDGDELAIIPPLSGAQINPDKKNTKN